MIAMSLMSTYDEYRRDRLAAAPIYAPPARSLRNTMLHALSLIGLGVGGIAASDDDDTLGIG
ncbi:MAG: hypothetical protein B7Y26_00805 [Hydrogenophilales bacterium 16-64-46]|nr:MAG: hypothetical protein B7Z32_10205 [Hydrogenophilales bacterium 12-64-13]OYZ07161.1 MAG: hypothetical protein B7Y26_00805 [Hydrogenophilales bacterium 16-64-46]OZA37370.1 MAG: hypothetical protein B7X87_11680 [Hydrogenophilales bacterium 17-64-34]HQT00612.1 hypothetical protein [Thiobacillus sp.]